MIKKDYITYLKTKLSLINSNSKYYYPVSGHIATANEVISDIMDQIERVKNPLFDMDIEFDPWNIDEYEID